MKQYDVIIIGAGPGGIYSAWEMAMKKSELKIAVFEKGRENVRLMGIQSRTV